MENGFPMVLDKAFHLCTHIPDTVYNTYVQYCIRNVLVDVNLILINLKKAYYLMSFFGSVLLKKMEMNLLNLGTI